LSAAAYAYRMYLKSARGACRKLEGKKRSYCIADYRIKGCDIAMAKLEQAKVKCRATSNMKDCVTKINIAIAKWKIRRARYEKQRAKIASRR